MTKAPWSAEDDRAVIEWTQRAKRQLEKLGVELFADDEEDYARNSESFLASIRKQRKLTPNRRNWLSRIVVKILKAREQTEDDFDDFDREIADIRKRLKQGDEARRQPLDKLPGLADKWRLMVEAGKDVRLKGGGIIRVLLVILDRFYTEKGYTELSLVDFAAGSRLEKRNVVHALDRLEKCGYLERKRSTGGQNKLSRYIVIFDRDSRQKNSVVHDTVAPQTVSPTTLYPDETVSSTTHATRARAVVRPITDSDPTTEKINPITPGRPDRVRVDAVASPSGVHLEAAQKGEAPASHTTHMEAARNGEATDSAKKVRVVLTDDDADDDTGALGSRYPVYPRSRVEPKPLPRQPSSAEIRANAYAFRSERVSTAGKDDPVPERRPRIRDL